MGRVTILATDIFFCVFGIFAALRTIVPHYEFTPTAYPAITVEWVVSRIEHCFVWASYSTGNGVGELISAPPAFTAPDRCSLTSGVALDGSVSQIEVQLVFPVLKTDAGLAIGINGLNEQSRGVTGAAHQIWTFTL